METNRKVIESGLEANAGQHKLNRAAQRKLVNATLKTQVSVQQAQLDEKRSDTFHAAWSGSELDEQSSVAAAATNLIKVRKPFVPFFPRARASAPATTTPLYALC